MTNTGKLKVIARSSALSLIQVDEVFGKLKEVEYELTKCTSYGDQHKEVSLMDNISADFFTRELDTAILNGTADIAVHSAKDLPFPLPEGLEIFAFTAASDKTDSLVSKDNLTIAQLPAGARIATSSPKRKAELLKMRSDLTIVSVRGTIGERIAQLDEGKFEALIVATCALQRLGLEDRISERLPFATHPLQGHLAIVGRKGDAARKKIFASLDDPKIQTKGIKAYYVPGTEIPSFVQKMSEAGIPQETPVDIVVNVAQPNQKEYLFTLADIRHTIVKANEPLLITVGDELAYANRPKKPLVLATGTKTVWAEKRGDVDHRPVIKTVMVDDSRLTAAREQIASVAKYDYVIFTSSYGAEYFFKIAGDAKIDWENTKVISVGSTTTNMLSNHGITPCYESATENAECIIAWLKEQTAASANILLPRSSIGIEALPRMLAENGNNVTDLPIYDTVTNRQELPSDFTPYHEVLFSSPSGVKAFKEIAGDLPCNVPLTAKGETTLQSLKTL